MRSKTVEETKRDAEAEQLKLANDRRELTFATQCG